MNDYGAKIEREKVLVEDERYTEKLPKFKNQAYHYSMLPSSRDFERLLYHIFCKNKGNKKLPCNYDEVILMQGTKERGRDISLRLKSENIGLVQCKKYTYSLTRNELGKEISKFVLFYLSDRQLISESKENFCYYIAVSSDIEEKGRDLISEMNKNEVHEDEVLKWIKSLKKDRDYAAFRGLDFEKYKEDIYKTFKKIDIIPITSTDLDAELNQHEDIANLFFKLDSVVNIETFEKVLSERERQVIELHSSLNAIERELNKNSPHLFAQLCKTKQKIQDLMNRHSTHFIEYSEHRKRHSKNLGEIISGILLQEEVNQLNENEMYTLANACYLTDIGACQPREEIEEKYKDDFAEFQKFNLFHSFEDYIQSNHYKISYDFIKENAETLEILEEYREIIALVAQAHHNIQKTIEDQSFYKADYSVNPYSIENVRVPYLAYLILIADNIDLENINSNKLLRKYKKYPHFVTSKSLWEEGKNKPKLEPKQKGKRLSFNGTIEDQLLYLGISDHLYQLEQMLKDCHNCLRKLPDGVKF